MVQTSNKQTKNASSKQNSMQEFVCGWGASFINIGVTYPVYKIMFRQVSPFNKQLRYIEKTNKTS